MKPHLSEKSILAFPDNYTVIDIETTGLDINHDFIIEVAAIKIAEKKEIKTFQKLIQSPIELTSRIKALTGISNEMLVHGVSFLSIADDLISFIGSDTIVGHSVLFDISFLSKALLNLSRASIENCYIDTLPLSQKVFPELVHHRLKDIACYYKFNTLHAHRALADCQMNFQIFEAMKQTILNTYGSYETFIEKWDSLSKHLKAEMISPVSSCFDCAHPLYKKNCVITGALNQLSRKEAMQAIANLGGINQDKLTIFTDFLILGNSTYCDLLSGMTKKQKKALRLIDEGYPITILSEEDFYQMLVPIQD